MGETMERRVSIREANLHLSRYLEDVQSGEEVVITKRGRPIARIVPEGRRRRELSPEQQAALKRVRRLLKKGYRLGGKAWPGREAIYERGR